MELLYYSLYFFYYDFFLIFIPFSTSQPRPFLHMVEAPDPSLAMETLVQGRSWPATSFDLIFVVGHHII